ncbi:hypothetical protein ACHAXT_003305 [Thalassiosira profunda]
MPFSWFGSSGGGGGGGAPLSSQSAPGRVTRKVSLSNSSSGNGNLAEVRAKASSKDIFCQHGDPCHYLCSFHVMLLQLKAKSSYLRKEMAQSGDLSSSRGRARSTHVHPARKKQPIVAVEPDPDQSRHRRLDQGLLDASREMQNTVLEPPNKSWWFSSSSAAAPPPPPQRAQSGPTVKLPSEGAAAPPEAKATGHRRTVSYTYKA